MTRCRAHPTAAGSQDHGLQKDHLLVLHHVREVPDRHFSLDGLGIVIWNVYWDSLARAASTHACLKLKNHYGYTSTGNAASHTWKRVWDNNFLPCQDGIHPYTKVSPALWRLRAGPYAQADVTLFG